jgi:hypothetical protein
MRALDRFDGLAYEKGRRWSEGIQRRPFCCLPALFCGLVKRQIPRFAREAGDLRVSFASA